AGSQQEPCPLSSDQTAPEKIEGQRLTEWQRNRAKCLPRQPDMRERQRHHQPDNQAGQHPAQPGEHRPPKPYRGRYRQQIKQRAAHLKREYAIAPEMQQRRVEVHIQDFAPLIGLDNWKRPCAAERDAARNQQIHGFIVMRAGRIGMERPQSKEGGNQQDEYAEGKKKSSHRNRCWRSAANNFNASVLALQRPLLQARSAPKQNRARVLRALFASLVPVLACGGSHRDGTRLGFRGLGQPQRQHAILIGRLGLFKVDSLWQAQPAAEPAITAFLHQRTALAIALLVLALV